MGQKKNKSPWGGYRKMRPKAIMKTTGGIMADKLDPDQKGRLQDFAREAWEKEQAILNSQGPPSTPPLHYQKTIKVKD
jgi:hypothetical protein